MKTYDYFLSHASEDKDVVARPVYHALTERKLSVWFDEVQLLPGDNIIDRINAGLRDSQCGLVIVSPTFLRKYFTMKEFDALAALGQFGAGVVTVLHDIDFSDYAQARPLEVQNLAIKAGTPPEEIADLLAQRAERDWDFKTDYRPGEYHEELQFPVGRLSFAIRSIETLLFRDDRSLFKCDVDLSVPRTWMGSGNSDLAELGFNSLFPLIYFGQKEHILERSIAEYGDVDIVVFRLLQLAFRAYVEEHRFATEFGSLDYSPRVTGWRAKRELHPAKFLLQGLNREELKKLINALEGRFGKDLTQVQATAFAEFFEETYAGGCQGARPLGLMFNAFFRFKPEHRPVFVRLLWMFHALFSASQDIFVSASAGKVASLVGKYLRRFQEATRNWDDRPDRQVCDDRALAEIERYLGSECPRLFAEDS